MALTLTFRADPDPILGDPDDTCVGPQDFKPHFTWDGPDDWLCEEVAEIEKEELDCAAVTPCEGDTIPLPQEVTGPPDGPPPELIQAPIDMEGPLELLPDGAPQRTTWHKSQVPAWALGGNKPSREVYGYPLHLLNLYFEAPVEGEPDIILLKAGRPAFDERVCAQPNPLPGPGATATELDVWITVSVLLKGEQNINLPSVGSKQHAAQSAPQIFIFPPSLDTCACGIVPGEGIAPIRYVANPHLESLRPPSLCKEPPDEPGGVGLGPVHMAGNAGIGDIKCMVIDTHKPGGVLLDTNGTPAPTKGTASVKLAGGAVKATTTQPKALDPWAKSKAWCGLETPPLSPP